MCFYWLFEKNRNNKFMFRKKKQSFRHHLGVVRRLVHGGTLPRVWALFAGVLACVYRKILVQQKKKPDLVVVSATQKI